jgi:FtsP/CotA-like multicopper oxidase with cupredoxin domain
MAVPGSATAAPFQTTPTPYYFSVPNYANSPLYNPLDTTNYPGIRKFVDSLPQLNETGANNLGQYIPVAVPDTVTYPGSDYYEIAVVEYSEQMHSDLPATRLRGYVQLSTSVVPGKGVALTNPDGTPITLPDGSSAIGVDIAHYMGPLIAATKDRPVRILFRNLLPKDAGGDLFIPTDTTVMGSGPGPNLTAADPDPQNPQCGVPYALKPAGCFAQNRATAHLHGGFSPWISDGTPHQWITPAGENTAYPKGVSVKNVPDMPDPGPGAMTLFYTNQQSARLLFYHDHAWGMTRLNVYAGGAAPYLISDATDQKLIANGVIPAETLPLVIQDKTFVPSDAQLIASDPLWDKERWGGFGQLWAPHVYVPAQNPGDSSGVNQFGRWAYGPWFWPPTNNIDYPPVNNPYFDPTCDPDTTWCEPELMPATPFNSMGMESFQDTPVVNGTAYPTVTVEPKAYRLRILNAANDRSFNLSLLQAADAAGAVCNASPALPAPGALAECTEVALDPAEVAAALTDPTVFPTPLADPAVTPPAGYSWVAAHPGPNWIQIGTEGGFLPAPVVIPPHITTWVNDPTVFNAGNVDKHSLLLGPAERADVIVDFSAFAGQTLILYNDAPAAFPARDPRYDYYTGNGDYTDTGGAPPTMAGYGPNTRTVMQIKVAAGAPVPFNQAALDAAFAHQVDPTTSEPVGVFESGQNPIIVGQGAYNSAYGTTFKNNGSRAGLVQIYDEYLAFDTLAGVPLVMPLQRKAIQDEMGEAFEREYGRMSGNLGLEAPNTQAGLQQNLILYPFVNPATEIVTPISLPPGVEATPISSANDGTQIWKITHNGVDTHPIHFHLFDVQVLNRVGWDGIIRKPDLNELGWKETVRISPLEDTIVALRPFLPKLPFGLPDSIRPLNPAMPLGSTEVFNNTDAFANPISPPITNEMTNFEWEYVWHCHILSHEEMDMMRPISALVNPVLPYPPKVTLVPDASGTVGLTWTDATPINYVSLATWGDMANEIGYRVERAEIRNNGNVRPYEVAGTTLANVVSFTDTPPNANRSYLYRVVAYNAAGETTSAPAGGGAVAAPEAPTNVVATLQAGPQVSLTWRDNARTEDFFLVKVSVDGGPFTLIAQVPARNNRGNVTYVDTMVSSSHSYQYQVNAVNAGGESVFIASNTITAAAAPAAPSNLTGTVVRTGNRAEVTLNWADNSTTETGFTIERATNAAFTVGLTPTTVAADTTTFVQSRLYRGVTYYFRIKADNLGGSSVWSNVFSIVTP